MHVCLPDIPCSNTARLSDEWGLYYFSEECLVQHSRSVGQGSEESECVSVWRWWRLGYCRQGRYSRYWELGEQVRG